MGLLVGENRESLFRSARPGLAWSSAGADHRGRIARTAAAAATTTRPFFASSRRKVCTCGVRSVSRMRYRSLCVYRSLRFVHRHRYSPQSPDKKRKRGMKLVSLWVSLEMKLLSRPKLYRGSHRKEKNLLIFYYGPCNVEDWRDRR